MIMENNVVIGHKIQFNDGQAKVTTNDATFVYPSINGSESILICGDANTGKTNLALTIALDEYTKGKTIFFIDLTQKYTQFQTCLPNDAIIMTPSYYLEMLAPHEIKQYGITTKYLAPINKTGLLELFEICGLNKEAGYAKVLDYIIRDCIVRYGEDTRIEHIIDSIQSIISDPNMKRFQWIYSMILSKLDQLHKHIFKSDNHSEIESILNSRIPRFVVVTLLDRDVSDFDSGILSIMLNEIRYFCRTNDKPVTLIFDDFEALMKRKNSMIYSHLEHLLFNRSDPNIRPIYVGNTKYVPKKFRGAINGDSSYSIVFQMSLFPLVGTVSWANYLQWNEEFIEDQSLKHLIVRNIRTKKLI